MYYNNRYSHKKIIMFLFYAFTTFFLICPILISYLVLPDEIKLIAGKEETLPFNIPVFATIKPEQDGSIKINRLNETGETGINPNESFSILSETEGKSDVVVSLFGTLPIKKMTVDTLPGTTVIPCGMTVGVRINTEGIMVLGTGFVNTADGGSKEPSKGNLKSGDLIISADGKNIENKEQLTEYIENSGGKTIAISLNRSGETVDVNITPVKCSDDGKYKMGCWVRDSTQGIGTVTYYNPDTLKFGALGHGIMDVDTKQLMSIKDGNIMHSAITSVKKGRKGAPGELLGNISNNRIIGNIKDNSVYGIYGYINGEINSGSAERTPIALQSQIHEGEAHILSNVESNKVEKYSVEILSVNRFSNDDSKGMIIKITDSELLNKTNGIVQGMSGSPIIQDGRLIGAVTHVFVQDPTKGYGIFIENMLKQEKSF